MVLDLPSTTAIRMSAIHQYWMERLHDQGKRRVAGWLDRGVSEVGCGLIIIDAQGILCSPNIFFRSIQGSLHNT
jgi:hypothetical protein